MTVTRTKFDSPISLEDAILDYYLGSRVPAAQRRLERLEEIGAPEIIIENERRLASAEHWQKQVPVMIASANKFNRLDSRVIGVKSSKTYKGQPCLVFEKEAYTSASKQFVTLLLDDHAVKNGDASY